MTAPAVVVTGGDTITHAGDVLAERGIHRLFVVAARSLSAPHPDRPDLARPLEHATRLRFRAAAIEDARMRGAVARTLRSRMTSELRAQVLR
ncbi:hypothetical protein [Sorangium sp. So ce1000]|uniref:hypothetical protein n=1 Tax=Sorangium sp. So ce1000 TaxID=3133325 RepID=UPI003F5FACB9